MSHKASHTPMLCPDNLVSYYVFMKKYFRGSRHTNSSAGLHDDLIDLGGGYDWQCGGMSAMANFFQREDVQKALNLGKPSLSRFDYDSSGP